MTEMKAIQVFEFNGAKVRTAGTFDAPLFCAADVRRFNEKVTFGPDCWEWTAYRNRNGNGYGVFGLGGRSVLAHRFAWLIEHGNWPSALACHRCDNPGCVRPLHLFDGSQLENIRDAAAKGRMSSGTANLKTRLSLADVRAIIESAEKANSLAETYGVSAVHIRRLRTGAWAPKAAQSEPMPVRRLPKTGTA